jgi:hypothetical protein
VPYENGHFPAFLAALLTLGKEKGGQPSSSEHTIDPSGRLSVRISHGYTLGVPKVLVSLPEPDLQAIDAAARKAGETRSAFLRRAGLAEARRLNRPIDDPNVRRAFLRLRERAERRKPITTAEALLAKERGRR